MPNYNQNGPRNLGSKTGKKLGKCRKTESEKKELQDINLLNKGTKNIISTM